MSFFDRFRKRVSSATTIPASPENRTVSVPEGHRVSVYPCTELPGVQQSAGGVLIVSQGTSSDDADAELDRLFQEVDQAIEGINCQVVMVSNGSSMSSLFAPADPEIRMLHGLLVWALDPETFVGSTQGARLLQRVFRKLYSIRRSSSPQLAQCVSLADISSPAGRVLAELVSQLGFPVREWEPGNKVVFLEVHRPEGIVLSAVVGRSVVPSSSEDRFLRETNEEKDCAEGKRDEAGLHALEEREREELAKRLGGANGKAAKSVSRAPRLGRLLLASLSGEGASRQALYEELVLRDIPLFIMVNPGNRTAVRQSWPGQGTAIPVFIDRAAVLQTAKDLRIPLESLVTAEMAPRDLFRWLAPQGSAVALNVFRDDRTPIYFRMSPEEVQSLGEGKVPQIAGMGV